MSGPLIGAGCALALVGMLSMLASFAVDLTAGVRLLRGGVLAWIIGVMLILLAALVRAA